MSRKTVSNRPLGAFIWPTALILLLAGLLSARWWLVKDADAFYKREAERDQAAEALAERLSTELDGLSPEQVAARFPPTSRDGSEMYTFDEATQRTLRMSFDGGQRGPWYVFVRAITRTDFLAAEWPRRSWFSATGMGLYIWVAVALLLVAVRTRRRLPAFIAAVWLLVCVASLLPGARFAMLGVDEYYDYARTRRHGVQFWSPVMGIGAAFLAVAMLAAIVVRGRAVNPLACRRCGYDLTGNESGVCPECGWRRPAFRFGRQAEKLAALGAPRGGSAPAAQDAAEPPAATTVTAASDPLQTARKE